VRAAQPPVKYSIGPIDVAAFSDIMGISTEEFFSASYHRGFIGLQTLSQDIDRNFERVVETRMPQLLKSE
jgi:hypothetical protein